MLKSTLEILDMKKLLVFLFVLCFFYPLFAGKYAISTELDFDESLGTCFTIIFSDSSRMFSTTLSSVEELCSFLALNSKFEDNFVAKAKNQSFDSCGIGYNVISSDKEFSSAMVYYDSISGIHTFLAEKGFMINFLNTFFTNEILTVEKYTSFDGGYTWSAPFLEYIEPENYSEFLKAKEQFDRFILYFNK